MNKEEPDEIDCQGEPEPRCPWCGATMRDAWELDLEDGEDEEVECGKCENPYIVTRLINISYDTAKPGDEE